MAKKKDDPSVYTGQYDEAVNRLANEYASSNYGDFTRGQDYADLAARYARNGQMAMKDTLGQVSARTGGLASSYATAAAANSYNDYMSKLEDAARSMYDSQQAERANKLGVMRQAANDEYGRYTDALDRDLTERKFAYTQQQDALDRDFNERKFAYSQEQDAYSRQQTAQKNAQALIQTYLQNGIDPSQIDPDILSASGYTAGTIQNLKDSYSAKSAYDSAAGNYGAGFSGGKPILTFDQLNKAIESGNVTESVKNLYKYYYGEDYKGNGKNGGDKKLVDYLKGLSKKEAVQYLDEKFTDEEMTFEEVMVMLDRIGIDEDEAERLIILNKTKNPIEYQQKAGIPNRMKK